ncbi:MAG: hypothetical protein WDW36_008455 [Sanguina aurantia]
MVLGVVNEHKTPARSGCSRLSPPPSSSSTAAAEAPDEELTSVPSEDKLEHLLSCFVISGLVYLACKRSPTYVRYRFHIAFLSGVLAGALKEIGDGLKLWPGEVSYKDLTADILGALLATCAAQLHERLSASSKQRPRMIDLAELGLLYGQPLSRGKNALLNLIGATKVANTASSALVRGRGVQSFQNFRTPAAASTTARHTLFLFHGSLRVFFHGSLRVFFHGSLRQPPPPQLPQASSA